MFRTDFLFIVRILVLYDIYLLLCIQYQTPDDGQKTCPKYVEFYSKNKFEKLVHLVGFIKGIRKTLSPCLNTPAPHHENIHRIGGMSPRILNSSTNCKVVVTLMPQRKGLFFPIWQKSGWVPGAAWNRTSVVEHCPALVYLLTSVAGILTHLYYKSISFGISCGLRSFRFSYVCVLQIFTKQWK